MSQTKSNNSTTTSTSLDELLAKLVASQVETGQRLAGLEAQLVALVSQQAPAPEAPAFVEKALAERAVADTGVAAGPPAPVGPRKSMDEVVDTISKEIVDAIVAEKLATLIPQLSPAPATPATPAPVEEPAPAKLITGNKPGGKLHDDEVVYGVTRVPFVEGNGDVKMQRRASTKGSAVIKYTDKLGKVYYRLWCDDGKSVRMAAEVAENGKYVRKLGSKRVVLPDGTRVGLKEAPETVKPGRTLAQEQARVASIKARMTQPGYVFPVGTSVSAHDNTQNNTVAFMVDRPDGLKRIVPASTIAVKDGKIMLAQAIADGDSLVAGLRPKITRHNNGPIAEGNTDGCTCHGSNLHGKTVAAGVLAREWLCPAAQALGPNEIEFTGIAGGNIKYVGQHYAHDISKFPSSLVNRMTPEDKEVWGIVTS